MSSSEEEVLREYFSSKLFSLEKIISHLPSDAVVLQVKGEKFQKHSAFSVELVMKMPTGTLTATEASHMITKAVDLAKDRLVLQLKKTTSQLHRGHRSLKAESKAKLRTASLV